MLFRDISPAIPHFVSRGSRRARRIGVALRLFVGSRMISHSNAGATGQSAGTGKKERVWFDLPSSHRVAADVQLETGYTKAYMKGWTVYIIYITLSQKQVESN